MMICKQPRRRLFWSIYLHGILLLLAIGATGVVVALVGGDPAWKVAAAAAQRYLVNELDPLLDKPEAIGEKLEAINANFRMDIAVYGSDHTLISSAGDKLLPPLQEIPETADAVHTWSNGFIRVAPFPSRRAYVLFRAPHPMGPRRGVTFIGIVLLLLALVSLPYARAITRPLEKLTDAARRIGAGELSTRSGISRNDEVGALAKAFDEMAGRLENLVRSEKELLANVSHELRTPLARIRIALQIAEETEDVTKIQSHLVGIGGDLGELEQLINDTLTAARLDLAQGRAEMPLRREAIRVDELVALAVQRFEQLHTPFALQTRITDGDFEFQADRVLLRRVLDNYLDNAARYADAEAGPVEIKATVREKVLRVEVNDQGSGVAEEDVPRLFDPFFRTDSSRARRSGGVGLGLALCKRIVEAHGGEVGVGLRPGGGMSFWMQLPV